MKKNSSNPARKPTPNQIALPEATLPQFNPEDYVYKFSENFPRVPNTLFANKENRLFLAGVENEKIDDLHEVSLSEALEWYAKCMPFSDCGHGSVELICEMAAKQLKEVA